MEDNIPPVIQQILYSDEKITIIFDTCIENDDVLDYYTTCLQSFFGITNIKWRDDQEVNIYTNTVKFTNIITEQINKGYQMSFATELHETSVFVNKQKKELEHICKIKSEQQEFIKSRLNSFINFMTDACRKFADDGEFSCNIRIYKLPLHVSGVLINALRAYDLRVEIIDSEPSDFYTCNVKFKDYVSETEFTYIKLSW